jgi:hypothetical protein
MSHNYVMPTRVARRRFPWKRYAAYLLVLGGSLYALQFSLVQGLIARSPVGRYATQINQVTLPYRTLAWYVIEPATRPFHFAAQQFTIKKKGDEITQLKKELNDAHTSISERDQQIKDLKAQAQSVSASSSPSPSPAANANAANGVGSAAAGSSAMSAASSDMKRTADYWAQMEPEKAAAIVERLPQSYVTQVFAAMPADQVSEIMNVLPARYAAKLAELPKAELPRRP